MASSLLVCRCGNCGVLYSSVENSNVRTTSHMHGLHLSRPQVSFNEQLDLWQCPTCQGPKTGFVEVGAKTTTAAPETAVPEAAPRTRVTMKELTEENPWVKYTQVTPCTMGRVQSDSCYRGVSLEVERTVRCMKLYAR